MPYTRNVPLPCHLCRTSLPQAISASDGLHSGVSQQLLACLVPHYRQLREDVGLLRLQLAGQQNLVAGLTQQVAQQQQMHHQHVLALSAKDVTVAELQLRVSQLQQMLVQLGVQLP